MRHVRLDDEAERLHVIEEREKAEAAERKKIAIEKARREADRKQAIEFEKTAAQYERARNEEARRVAAELAVPQEEVIRHRRMVGMRHPNASAPSLRDLAKKDSWTPEDLAYVQFYFRTGSPLSSRVSSFRWRQEPIMLYGNQFVWDGTRYVKAR